MLDLERLQTDYLDYCRYQKNLNEKTLKAYRIDLTQFLTYLETGQVELGHASLVNYITYLHKTFRPKSVKRKIASLKAFCSYLEYEEILPENPFQRIKTKFQEPFLLPRTIPFHCIQALFTAAYREKENSSGSKAALRDIAVLELLFATGLRVSELCQLRPGDVDLEQGVVRIYGKGAKERVVPVQNQDVLSALKSYQRVFAADIEAADAFFINRLHHRLSEQSVRHMINKYIVLAGIPLHVTPHMFRHSFATLLLEEDPGTCLFRPFPLIAQPLRLIKHTITGSKVRSASENRVRLRIPHWRAASLTRFSIVRITKPAIFWILHQYPHTSKIRFCPAISHGIGLCRRVCMRRQSCRRSPPRA